MKFSGQRIFGKQKLSLEESIFQSVTFLASVFTLYYVFHGYFIGLNLGVRVINVVSFIGFSIFFIFSRKQGYFKSLVIPFIIFTTIVMGFAWFFNGGSEGAMPFLYQLGFVSFIMISDSRYHTFLFFWVLSNLLLVTAIEFFCPEILAIYPSDAMRKTDVFIGNFLAILFIGLLINMLKRNYGREKDKVNRQKQELEAAYHTKSRFLANMSHEIRTPMNGMLGMTAVLANTSLTAQQREYLSAVQVSGDRLLNIINEILEYSKIEAGEMKLNLEPFSIYQCLSEVVDITAPKAYSKNLELACVISKDAPRMIVGDFLKVRQVLLNIIGNALKFTHEGEIYIKVSQLERIGDKAKLQFSIRDTGIGIANKDTNALFESFTQVDDSNRRIYGGTGLGLAICKEFVEMMEGNIWLESEEGKGSTFYFTIVAAVSDEEDLDPYVLPKEKMESLKDKQMLLIEDNDTNRKLIESILVSWGGLVESFSNAQEASNWLKKTEKDVDLAIIDYRLPQMNGWDFGKKLEEEGHSFAKILMVSHDNLDILEVSKTFRSLILKPLKAHQLFETIVNLFSEKAVDMNEKSKRKTIDSSLAKTVPLQILLVEDDLVNQKLSLSLLGLMGYAPDLAENGEAAVEMVAKGNYDLVLMDIQLPKMDGFQSTQAIRKLALAQQPVVIAMTANVLDEVQEKCAKAGMNHFVRKPINIPKLEELLQGIGELPK